jgi:hypothetical protein
MKDGVGADETVDPQTGAIVSNHKSKEERAFVRRLDMFLMTFGCLSQIIKYLGTFASTVLRKGRLISGWVFLDRSNQYIFSL